MPPQNADPCPAAVRNALRNAARNAKNGHVAYNPAAPPFAAGSNQDPCHISEGNWLSAIEGFPLDMRCIDDGGIERWLTMLSVYHRTLLRYFTLPPGQRGELEINPNTRVPGGRTKLTTVAGGGLFNVEHANNPNDTAIPPRLMLRYVPQCDKYVVVVDLNNCDFIIVLGLKANDLNAPNVPELRQMSSNFYVDVKSLLMETLGQHNILDGVGVLGYPVAGYYNEGYLFIEDNNGTFGDVRGLGVRMLKRVAKNTTANGLPPRFTWSHTFQFDGPPGGAPIHKILQLGMCGMMITAAILMGGAPVNGMLDHTSGRGKDTEAGRCRVYRAQIRVGSFEVGNECIYVACWRSDYHRRRLEITDIRNDHAEKAASVHVFWDPVAAAAAGVPNPLHGDRKF